MSPRTGRPPKGDVKREKLTLRISQETARKLQLCAERLRISRTEVIEKGIDKVEAEINE